MMKYLLITILLYTATAAKAQDWNTLQPHDIVVLYSTRSYDAALKVANAAGRQLHYPVMLGSYKPHKTAGLSMTKQNCENDGYEYPCYIARGNGAGNDDQYISIEYSNAYEEMAKGYYIVVAATGNPGSNPVKETLALARSFYKDAYAKRVRVWFGCMH